MSMKYCVCALTSILLFMTVLVPVHADQASYVKKEQAEKAVNILRDAKQLRSFCPPCGDKRWIPKEVARVEMKDAGYENFYEVFVNDEPIDLAYIYVPAAGKWQNLAMAVGATVDSVPAALDDSVKGALPDFFRGYYTGTIGENLKIRVDLTKEGEDLYGTYVYDGKESPLRLTGTVDTEGALTLTELVDDRKTGLFNGELDSEARNAKGEWSSADRSKKFPFTFVRAATERVDEKQAKAGGHELVAYLNYPHFELPDSASAMRLNDAISKAVNSRYETFLAALKNTQAEQSKPSEQPAPKPPAEDGDAALPADADGEDVDRAYSFNIGEYVITYFSEKFVSIHLVAYEDAGGAHPNTFTMTLNLAMRSDAPPKKVELADLLVTGDASRKMLSDFCIAELKKAGASQVANGVLKELTLEEMSDFTVDPQKLTIYFDPYAVASYAEGAFEVSVPRSALSEAMKPDILAGFGFAPAP
jgi:hypothetical protein